VWSPPLAGVCLDFVGELIAEQELSSAEDADSRLETRKCIYRDIEKPCMWDMEKSDIPNKLRWKENKAYHKH